MATELYHAGSATDSFTAEDFFTGETPITTAQVTVLSGEGVVPKRSVLGIVTASGKAVLSLSAAVDGSEVPAYILVDEVDATSSDVVTQAYATCCCNPDLLNIGTGHDADSIREPLRDRGILLKTPV